MRSLSKLRYINALQWLGRRQQAERLAQADAEALMRDHGREGYRVARQRERDVILADGTTHAGRTPAHWRRVALIVAKRTGHRVGLDTATRMVKDADISPDRKSSEPRPQTPSPPPAPDPIEELVRVVGEAPGPPSKAKKAPPTSRRAKAAAKYRDWGNEQRH